MLCRSAALQRVAMMMPNQVIAWTLAAFIGNDHLCLTTREI
jgi:hypothetical protein